MLVEVRPIRPTDMVANSPTCKWCGRTFTRVAVFDTGVVNAFFCDHCDRP